MTKSIQIADVKIDYPLLAKFPAEFLIKNLFFPIEENNGSISVAMPDPDNLDKIGMIENFTQKKVVPFLANRDELFPRKPGKWVRGVQLATGVRDALGPSRRR